MRVSIHRAATARREQMKQRIVYTEEGNYEADYPTATELSEHRRKQDEYEIAHWEKERELELAASVGDFELIEWAASRP